MKNMELSYLWTILGFLGFVRSLLPVEIAEALHRALRLLNSYLVPYVVLEIPEFEGSHINELYKNVQLHVTATDLCRSARKTVLCRVKNSSNTTATLAGNRASVISLNRHGWPASVGFDTFLQGIVRVVHLNNIMVPGMVLIKFRLVAMLQEGKQ